MAEPGGREPKEEPNVHPELHVAVGYMVQGGELPHYTANTGELIATNEAPHSTSISADHNNPNQAPPRTTVANTAVNRLRSSHSSQSFEDFQDFPYRVTASRTSQRDAKKQRSEQLELARQAAHQEALQRGQPQPLRIFPPPEPQAVAVREFVNVEQRQIVNPIHHPAPVRPLQGLQGLRLIDSGPAYPNLPPYDRETGSPILTRFPYGIGSGVAFEPGFFVAPPQPPIRFNAENVESSNTVNEIDRFSEDNIPTSSTQATANSTEAANRIHLPTASLARRFRERLQLNNTDPTPEDPFEASHTELSTLNDADPTSEDPFDTLQTGLAKSNNMGRPSDDPFDVQEWDECFKHSEAPNNSPEQLTVEPEPVSYTTVGSVVKNNAMPTFSPPVRVQREGATRRQALVPVQNRGFDQYKSAFNTVSGHMGPSFQPNFTPPRAEQRLNSLFTPPRSVKPALLQQQNLQAQPSPQFPGQQRQIAMQPYYQDSTQPQTPVQPNFPQNVMQMDSTQSQVQSQVPQQQSSLPQLSDPYLTMLQQRLVVKGITKLTDVEEAILRQHSMPSPTELLTPQRSELPGPSNLSNEYPDQNRGINQGFAQSAYGSPMAPHQHESAKSYQQMLAENQMNTGYAQPTSSSHLANVSMQSLLSLAQYPNRDQQAAKEQLQYLEAKYHSAAMASTGASFQQPMGYGGNSETGFGLYPQPEYNQTFAMEHLALSEYNARASSAIAPPPGLPYPVKQGQTFGGYARGNNKRLEEELFGQQDPQGMYSQKSSRTETPASQVAPPPGFPAKAAAPAITATAGPSVEKKQTMLRSVPALTSWSNLRTGAIMETKEVEVPNTPWGPHSSLNKFTSVPTAASVIKDTGTKEQAAAYYPNGFPEDFGKRPAPGSLFLGYSHPATDKWGGIPTMAGKTREETLLHHAKMVVASAKDKDFFKETMENDREMEEIVAKMERDERRAAGENVPPSPDLGPIGDRRTLTAEQINNFNARTVGDMLLKPVFRSLLRQGQDTKSGKGVFREAYPHELDLSKVGLQSAFASLNKPLPPIVPKVSRFFPQGNQSGGASSSSASSNAASSSAARPREGKNGEISTTFSAAPTPAQAAEKGKGKANSGGPSTQQGFQPTPRSQNGGGRR
jgi:hypothetical protein